MLKSELFGLVVCGGKSTRMGTDKCFLNYHGQPQVYHLHEMMQPLCKQVFISCNQVQVQKFNAAYHTIVDNPEYENIGPMAALLSALKKYPDQSFLVVGCDYPFIEKKDLQLLLDTRDKNAVAVCYENEQKMIETLVAVYEKEIFPTLLNSFDEKKYSLRYMLEESNIKKIMPFSYANLKSVDTLEDFNTVLRLIKL